MASDIWLFHLEDKTSRRVMVSVIRAAASEPEAAELIREMLERWDDAASSFVTLLRCWSRPTEARTICGSFSRHPWRCEK